MAPEGTFGESTQDLLRKEVRLDPEEVEISFAPAPVTRNLRLYLSPPRPNCNTLAGGRLPEFRRCYNRGVTHTLAGTGKAPVARISGRTGKIRPDRANVWAPDSNFWIIFLPSPLTPHLSPSRFEVDLSFLFVFRLEGPGEGPSDQNNRSGTFEVIVFSFCREGVKFILSAANCGNKFRFPCNIENLPLE